MPDACPNCGGNSFDYSDGQVICNNCGTIVEESNIVSDVTFIEGGDGSSSVVGQFVPTSGQRSFGGRGLPGVQRPTREITLANGRRRIAQLAQSLHLRSQHVDAAQRLFMLAVQHNFTQGRRSQHVVAACLYIVCRRQKTPHMLIDFSDVLQVNVYVLGQTFLRLCQTLNIQPPVIDPSLYIHRFAAKLDFEDDEHQVATTALRIVQRMSRDWMQTGRRPAGICGAALLIAARLHGFNRTQKEIVNVVNICELTLRKRLVEFENTGAAQQSFDDFQDESKDTEIPESDPPAFRRARLVEELDAAKKAGDEAKISEIIKQILAIDRPQRAPKVTEEDEEEEEEEPEEEKPKKKAKSKGNGKKRKRSADKEEEAKQEEKADASDAAPPKRPKRKVATKKDEDMVVDDDESASEPEEEEEDASAKKNKSSKKGKVNAKAAKLKKGKKVAAESKKKTKDVVAGPPKLEIDIEQEQNPQEMEQEMQVALETASQFTAAQVSVPLLPSIPDNDADDAGQTQENAASASATPTQGPTQNPANESQNAQPAPQAGDDDGNFEDIDDTELTHYFASDAEKNTRTAIWEEMNRDWIEKQEEKARLKAAQDEIDALVDGGKKKRAPKKKRPLNAAATPAEAASDAIQRKVPTKSEKVNYSGLKMDSLFKRLGQDVSAFGLEAAAPNPGDDEFPFVPPTPRQRRVISSLGEVMDPATPDPSAASEASMMVQSGQFVAPVTTYRTQRSIATPNPAASAADAAEPTEGAEDPDDYYEEGGDEYYEEGEEGAYGQDEYEAEYARMKQTAAAAEDDAYYDDYY